MLVYEYEYVSEPNRILQCVQNRLFVLVTRNDTPMTGPNALIL